MKRILVATDFSERGRQAYEAAASLAKAYGAALDLVHEAETPSPFLVDDANASTTFDHYYDQLAADLREETRHQALHGLEVTPCLLNRKAGSENIATFAQAHDVDLIIMCTHGRSALRHALLGSFVERVARHSVVPVMTYRGPGIAGAVFQPRVVLVPFDFSENSKAVFPVVRRFAERFGAQVRVLHVFADVLIDGDWGVVQERLRVSAETSEKLIDRLRDLCGKELPGLTVFVESRFGDPYHEILKEARIENPDLIIMATHGRTGLSHFYFGSVAEKVLRTSPCSVITVRPPNLAGKPR
jgi:nucleotide-binding universal stress UspA family protein